MQAGEYRRLFDLSGRIALVTGAVGNLGPHCCAALADHGASVAALDLDEEVVATLAGEIESRFGVRCIGLACDITEPDRVAATVATVERELGPITILHNNAQGTSESLDRYFAPMGRYDLQTWREVMAVNLDGAFVVAQEVGSRMAARGGGSIVQTASIYGIMGPDQRIYEGSEYKGRPISSPAVYSASKAGLIGLTLYLAAYWGDRGVRVNALTPGGVASGQNETFTQRYAARVPMGRMATVKDVVGALVFLASDASSYITGQNIVVDGGLAAW